MDAKKVILKLIFWIVVLVCGFSLLFYWNGYKIGLPVLVIWWASDTIRDIGIKLISKNVDRITGILEKITGV